MMGAALVGAVLTLFATAPALAAQGPTSGAVEPAEALMVNSSDVSGYPQIEVEVTAPNSLASQLLDGEDFTLVEEGATRDVVATRLGGGEQEIVLVIDVSGSMRGASIEGAKAAASGFVNGAPQGARIAIVAFGADASVVTDFTLDTATLLTGIASLQAEGDTALFDAVTRATDLLAAGPSTVETIVLLSDGDDTASVQTSSAARDRIVASEAAFIGVQLVTAATDPADLRTLVAAADATLVTADDAAALATAYADLAVKSGNRYTLRYRSMARGPTELDIVLRAGDTVRRVDDYVVNLPVGAATQDPTSAPSAAVAAPGSTTGAAEVAAGTPTMSPLAVVAAIAAWCIAVGIVLFVVLPAPTRRLPAERRDPLSVRQSSRLTGTTELVSGFIDQSLTRSGWSPVPAAMLERAGVKMRLQDVLLLVVSATLAVAAAGLVVAGPIVAVLVAAAIPFGARFYLNVLAGRCKAKFADQLDDTLQLIASSLRAGHSLLRAVDAVSREAESPTAEEFSRMINETRLGRDLGPTLEDTAARMGSEDFTWVAQAVAIHREVGGNLAEVLDEVGNTIRERNQIRRQVKALSAEGKLSAIVLMSLPVGVTAFLSLTNPTYIGKFTQSLLGYGMIAAAVTLMLVGGLWLRKVVRFKF